MAQIHEEHDVARDEEREFRCIIGRAESTSNLSNKQGKKRNKSRVAGRPAFSVHNRFGWTIASASERVLVARVRTARDLVVSSCLDHEFHGFRPTSVEWSRIAGGIVVLVGERENCGERVDFEFSLEDVGCHGVLCRSLRIKVGLQEDESSRALCVIVCVGIRMTCFIKVKSVGVRIYQHRFHLTIQNTTNQCKQLRILTSKSQIGNNLASWRVDNCIPGSYYLEATLQ